MDSLNKWQLPIQENLKKIISNEKTTTPWNNKILEELFQFSILGKCIRGSLFLSLFETLGYSLQDVHLQASAGIELTHSSLLIHDDIIDEDTKRRNKPTIHCRFEPKPFGQAVAICMGGVGFWISCKYIALLGKNPYDFFIKEMINVSCGQIQDVFLGYQKNVTFDTIIQMYVDKTSRYTFFLPMTLFCIVTNQKKERFDIYNELSHSLGILYQIVDDELGIFGDVTVTGKPIGSDLMKLKKNIYWFYLKKEKFPFSKYNKQFNIQEIQDFINKTNVQKNVTSYKKSLLKKIENSIEKLQLEEKLFFTNLKNYITNRKK